MRSGAGRAERGLRRGCRRSRAAGLGAIPPRLGRSPFDRKERAGLADRHMHRATAAPRCFSDVLDRAPCRVVPTPPLPLPPPPPPPKCCSRCRWSSGTPDSVGRGSWFLRKPGTCPGSEAPLVPLDSLTQCTFVFPCHRHRRDASAGPCAASSAGSCPALDGASCPPSPVAVLLYADDVSVPWCRLCIHCLIHLIFVSFWSKRQWCSPPSSSTGVLRHGSPDTTGRHRSRQLSFQWASYDAPRIPMPTSYG